MMTAYDYPSAKAVSEAEIDIILVGDSLAQVVLGHDDTLSITVDEMLHHVKAVTNAKPSALVVADMPYMSYHISKEETIGWDEFLPKDLGGNSNEFDWNLTNFTHENYDKHLWLLTGENFGREFSNQFNKKLCGKWGKYFFSVEENSGIIFWPINIEYF